MDIGNNGLSYNRKVIDKKLSNKVDELEQKVEKIEQGNIDIDLQGYATKEDLQGLATKGELQGYATKKYVDDEVDKVEQGNIGVDLQNYVTKTDLQNYVTKTNLQSYATKSELQAMSSSYVTITSLQSNYVAKTDLQNYATITTLQNYATKTSLQSYATITSLQAYATKTYVDNEISKIGESSVGVDLKNYVSKTEIQSYATKAEVSSNYATKTNLQSYVTITSLQNNYITKTEISNNYATKTSLQSYVTITSLQNNYATKTELSSNYATKTELSNNYATKSYVNSAVTPEKIENAVYVDSYRQSGENWDVTINRLIQANKKVYFLNHEYELYNTIYFKNNTNLIMSENTILTRKHQGYMFTNTYNQNSINYNATDTINIENGIIVHNGVSNAKNCCILFHARNINFKNVTFKNIVASHAIDLVGCENVNIVDCQFLGYNHEANAAKYREVIQIDAATHSGAGFGDLYPTSSACYDGTRTRNVLIENCIFDKSETLPPAHNCIGTHSQIAPPLRNDLRSNNIRIINNRFYGNKVVSTEKDDGSVSMAGKCIRLIQMENVIIQNNTFENFGRAVSIEIFATARSLNGGTVTNTSTLLTYPLGCVNVSIINNKMDLTEINDADDYYAWNGISVSSSITSAKHENIIIQNNNISNNGKVKSVSVGIRNLQNGTITLNNFVGGFRGIYVETENGLNITSNSNNYVNVTKPSDYVGAFSNNSGECISLCEDGTNNEYILYVVNSSNSSSVPQLRVKCATTGSYATILTDKSATATNLSNILDDIINE